jgi:hypothetical protein
MPEILNEFFDLLIYFHDHRLCKSLMQSYSFIWNMAYISLIANYILRKNVAAEIPWVLKDEKK